MRTRLVIYSDEGMVLTNGELYGKQIFLAEGMSADDFYEISDKEYAGITASEADELVLDTQLCGCDF